MAVNYFNKKNGKRGYTSLREWNEARRKEDPSSNRTIKETIKRGVNWASENPWKTAAGVVMLHPGARAAVGGAKLLKSIHKIATKQRSGQGFRRWWGTRVQGQGKKYKTEAQAEVASGGTKLHGKRGITIDRTGDGFTVNPSRMNVIKNWKTLALGAGGAAYLADAKSDVGGITVNNKDPFKRTKNNNNNKKVKDDSKGNITISGNNKKNNNKKNAVVKKKKDDVIRWDETKKKRNGNKLARKTKKDKDAESLLMREKKYVKYAKDDRLAVSRNNKNKKKKKRKDVAGSGARAFRKRLGGY